MRPQDHPFGACTTVIGTTVLGRIQCRRTGQRRPDKFQRHLAIQDVSRTFAEELYHLQRDCERHGLGQEAPLGGLGVQKSAFGHSAVLLAAPPVEEKDRKRIGCSGWCVGSVDDLKLQTFTQRPSPQRSLVNHG